MSKKKKVLMLASVASMIDQFNMPNIQMMQKMGYEVHVACNFLEGNTCDANRIRKFQQLLTNMDVKQHQWDCPRNIGSLKKCLTAFWQLWRLTRQHHFEWMHCHSPVGGALSRIVSHFRKISVIYTAHGFHFYQGAPFKNWLLYYSAERLLAYWTDVLITVNKEDYTLAKNHLKAGNICRIPGVGIDVQRFQNCAKDKAAKDRNVIRKRYNIPQDAIVLLSVGELSKRKNHQEVLKALAQMKRQDLYYLICGQGAMEKRLIQKAKKYNILKYVRFCGFQEDVETICRSADIFVFPSLQEGFPAALMEAMAAGLPCIVSDIRGNRELIADQMRFQPGRTKEMQRILDEVIRNPQLLMHLGDRNQEQIKKYDVQKVNCKMKKIYDSMRVSASYGRTKA